MPLQAVRAATLRYAIPSGGAVLGTCNSWANACTLHSALDNAGSGAEVWVAKGTYYPTTGTDRTETFQLKSGVAVYGGFAGNETARNQRNPKANVTILSGEIGNPVRATDNSYHVVTGSGTDNTAILDGFTISGGYADGSTNNQGLGAGMFNNNGSPTLANLSITGNTAQYGGGMDNNQSSPSLNGVSFTSNTATNYGGGMEIYTNSAPTLNNVTFSGNSATDGGGINCENSAGTIQSAQFEANSADYGGGMQMNNCTSQLQNVTFSSNTATYDGGGMRITTSSSAVLSNLTFTGNSASSGGGMYIYNSSLSVQTLTFQGNTASGGGGMFIDTVNGMTLTGLTFNGNTADNNGGGIRLSGSSLLIENSAILDNSAQFGGGISNYESSPSLVDVTFSGNSATGVGGGMFNWRSSNPSQPSLTNVTLIGNSAGSGGGVATEDGSLTTIQNSVLWGNTASSSGPQIFNLADGTATVKHSIVQGGYLGEAVLDADPLLGSLGTYGGSTQVFPLLPGSAAINSADGATCASTDQRGITRPQGAGCDMGHTNRAASTCPFPAVMARAPGSPRPLAFRWQSASPAVIRNR